MAIHGKSIKLSQLKATQFKNGEIGVSKTAFIERIATTEVYQVIFQFVDSKASKLFCHRDVCFAAVKTQMKPRLHSEPHYP